MWMGLFNADTLKPDVKSIIGCWPLGEKTKNKKLNDLVWSTVQRKIFNVWHVHESWKKIDIWLNGVRGKRMSIHLNRSIWWCKHIQQIQKFKKKHERRKRRKKNSCWKIYTIYEFLSVRLSNYRRIPTQSVLEVLFWKMS